MALEKPEKTGFSNKSKVAFSKTEVLKKPQIFGTILYREVKVLGKGKKQA
ncbi:MAG: hypothetical protein FWG07_10370 [Treponema sp.]|nr:hypothetical protein [Treponema sp.]